MNHHKANGKLEWAAIAALSFLFVDHMPSVGAIYFGIATFLIFLISDLVRNLVKRFLISAFEIPFLIIVAVTLFQIVNLSSSFSGMEGNYIFLIPVVLLPLSSKKFSERIETGIYFLIFLLLMIAIKSLFKGAYAALYPIVLLIAALGFTILASSRFVQKKRSP
ncbi:MAG: hypothetical protein HY582_00115 [Candidatus Omnitrophica bacterium]|nr:hypothetical protein [Candidatus Omnitrophota bacterium]